MSHSQQHRMSVVLQATVLVLCVATAFSQELFLFGEDPEASSLHEGTPWTYDQSGDDWSGTDAQGDPWVCLTGQQQSPVNLPTAATAVSLVDVTHRSIFQLGSMVSNGSNARVRNSGHSVEVAWSDPGFAPKISIVLQENKPLLSNIDLAYGNKISTVTAVPRQFHFHTHSEHLLAGKIFPLEAHLVSAVPQSQMGSCPATGCLVVTAVLYELADDITVDNQWLKTFFDVMPYKEEEESYLADGTELDLQSLLPSNASYLAYSGSLTTPPCSEGVLWMVMVNTQKISLQQWRAFQKAVGDYNCTLLPDTVGNSSSSSAPAKPVNSSRSSTQPMSKDTAALPAKADNGSRRLLSMMDVAASAAHSIRLPYIGQRRQLLQAVAAAPAGQHYVCDKLGQGVNARYPQSLNQRATRLWTDSKKSYLPEDAAAAASAGAVAGIVLGTTLGAGLTALIGFVAYKQYQKRRIKRLYNLGVSNNDMMMVHQEVESQWLTSGAGRNDRNAPV